MAACDFNLCFTFVHGKFLLVILGSLWMLYENLAYIFLILLLISKNILNSYIYIYTFLFHVNKILKFSHTLFIGKYYLVDAGYPYFKATWTPTKILGTISLILDWGQEPEEEMKC